LSEHRTKFEDDAELDSPSRAGLSRPRRPQAQRGHGPAPWFENLGKRLVKSPKVYVRDTGLLHLLLGIPDLRALQSHPKLGASWECFCIEQLLARIGDRHAFFWATHGGAELDLLLTLRGKRWGFEFKYQDAPTMTRSMYVALEDLKLTHLWVVYPGDSSYALHRRADCVGLSDLPRITRAITRDGAGRPTARPP